MRILLPPSEGKTPGHGDTQLDLDLLVAPTLTTARLTVIDALRRLCAADQSHAMRTLKLGATQTDEITRNTELLNAPTAPAKDIYTGVLYDALSLQTMETDTAKRADDQILIFSGLWGIIRPQDPIAAYRCAAGVSLPHLGTNKPTGIATYWRRHLNTVLQDELDGAFVLDLRSTPYIGMAPTIDNSATIRVLNEKTVNGQTSRTVVSHFNKATKGRISADLLTNNVQSIDVSGLVSALRDLGYQAENNNDTPHRIDVIVTNQQ